MIKAIVIDDEKLTREMLASIIKNQCSDVEVIAQADDVKSGLEQIKLHNPDLVLLDIKLPDGTGFDIIKQLGKINFMLIFITAYEEYAIQAFKCSALDYILKPVNTIELIDAINKCRETYENKILTQKLSVFLSNMDSNSKEDKKIVLKTAESVNIVKVVDIVRCESYKSYTQFFLTGSKKHIVSRTLKDYDELLTEYGFFRSHQSHLVNINFIESFEKSQGGYILMSDGSQVPVSQRKREDLLKLFEEM